MTERPELPPRYVAAEVEPAIYERWLASGAFTPSAEPRPGAERFVITMPPPNVTGALHLGHALPPTLEDILVRYHRMRGDDTLWLPGVDHASIAAQFVLDKIIAEEGESRASLGRERYLERMWQLHGRDARHDRPPACAAWAPPPTGPATRFTMDPSAARAPCAPPSSGCWDARAGRTAARRWSTGARAAGPRSATWRTCRARRPARSGRSATTWREPMAPRIRTHWISGRHHAPGDDAGRHGGGGPPRRRALPRARGARGDPALPRAPPADHRRRGGRAGVRHRRGEDHPRPRPRRLRDRPAPRAAGDQRSSTRRRASTRRAGEFAGLDRYEARAADRGASCARWATWRRSARTRW